jgi:hypothetical protein
LENEDAINPHVLAKLRELTNLGAVIVGHKPKRIEKINNSPLTQKEGENLINQLWANAKTEKGQIVSETTPLEMLNNLNVSPDFNYFDKESFLLDFIHYKKDDVDFFFIRNTTDKYVSRKCSFRLQDKIPEIWDPVSGEIIPVLIYDQNEKYISMPITLTPFGSQLIVLRKKQAHPHYSQIKTEEQHPPLLAFTKKGFLLLKNSTAELKKQDKSRTINNNIQTQALNGPWELFFPENWGAPVKIVLDELISWTNSDVDGIKYFSGTVTYKKTFQYDLKPTSSDKVNIYLDLGNISKIAEVWLNGKHLGITWSKPYIFDVTDIIQNGENNLTIEVANTWSNRLTGDAILGENYTSTNILKTIVATKGILPGDQTRVPWAKVPLIESGLLGPVSIKAISIFK